MTESVRVGRFRCTPDHPEFHTAGAISQPLVVFPRCPVWIQHTRARPFIADQNGATIYNAGQEYTREEVTREGDRSDYFAVSPAVALSIAETYRAGPDSEHPFLAAYAATDSALYWRQRSLFNRIRSGLVEPLKGEQEVMEIIAAVIRRSASDEPKASTATVRRRRDLVAAAQELMGENLQTDLSVTSVARWLGVSPFHLCRLFRRETGATLHRYRLELRLRAALELLGAGGLTLSEIAHRLGFSSHSHFTSIFRRRIGLLPREARCALGSHP